jgi:hypothetical protein
MEPNLYGPLSGFTEDQLQEELNKRNILAKFPKPSGLTASERESKVQKLVIDLITRHGTEEEREDDDHYFFEAVMGIYYGQELWPWWNSIER